LCGFAESKTVDGETSLQCGCAAKGFESLAEPLPFVAVIGLFGFVAARRKRKNLGIAE